MLYSPMGMNRMKRLTLVGCRQRHAGDGPRVDVMTVLVKDRSGHLRLLKKGLRKESIPPAAICATVCFWTGLPKFLQRQ